jgi:hypothetical protein
MIVEFVAEPPVPNVYLGEEHIPSHLCSVRHKRTAFTLQRPPPSKPIPRIYRTHSKIIFPLSALSIFRLWIDFYRNVNFSALLEAHLIAIFGSK